MRQAAERQIRVRFVHTPYSHWGRHSGYPCFVAHLDPLRFRTEKHGAADNHEQIPLWLRPAKPWIRDALKRRRMKWYKVSDLNAELAAFGRCLAGQLDVVHFLDGEHSAQFLPRMLEVAGSKALTVATFHQPPQFLEELVDPAVVPGFDHVVLMSPSQRRFFEGLLPDEKVSVIPHGVDTGFFHPRRAQVPSHPFRCITVGHWLRDWRIVRSVAERMPAVEFHIVTSRETGLEDLSNVVRHRSVSDEMLAALYRSADVLFLPLLDSTANNALMEGLASGLPVVTTDLPAVRAYLAGEEAIVAPEGDADAALAAVDSLLQDSALRRRMGACARARAETLSWPRVASRYEALFTELHRARRRA